MSPSLLIVQTFNAETAQVRASRKIRRTSAPTASGPATSEPARVYFDLAIDVAAREVARGGDPLVLTRVEFDLLAALAERPGVVLTREQLGGLVFGIGMIAEKAPRHRPDQPAIFFQAAIYGRWVPCGNAI